LVEQNWSINKFFHFVIAKSGERVPLSSIPPFNEPDKAILLLYLNAFLPCLFPFSTARLLRQPHTPLFPILSFSFGFLAMTPPCVSLLIATLLQVDF